MSLRHIPLPYEIDGKAYDGVLVTGSPAEDADDTATAEQTVLVFHGMEGRSDAQLAFCDRLAGLGYQAVAVDVFGEDVTPASNWMDAGRDVTMRFLGARKALAQRLAQVFETVTSAPGVAGTATVAMGFCFGGLCVLDLARAGSAVVNGGDLRGVASFHGILTAPPDQPASAVTAKIAVYHGWDDPFATPEDVVALGAELSGRGIDWQLHAYGDTVHAFMAPMADDPEHGIEYSETAATRAWESFVGFLRDAFDD